MFARKFIFPPPPPKFRKFRVLFYTKRFCVIIPSQNVSALWNLARLLLQRALSLPTHSSQIQYLAYKTPVDIS
jgi:hypothetical protein